MTLTQLQYIIAVEEHGSFVKAAGYCNVTQSTLSMQIKKLEDTLDIQIFDRSKKPLQATPVGKAIIEQAKTGISEIERIYKIVEANQQSLPNIIKVGIIPTLSPYLIPLFLIPFSQKNPTTKIVIHEMLTEQIISKINDNQLDLGILISPLENSSLITKTIFYEPFLGYISESHPLYRKSWIQSSDLQMDHFWFLESGHCFRNQVINICKQTFVTNANARVHFESGNLETIRKLIDAQHGFTLLPHLATLELNEQQAAKIREFKPPVPVREVSIAAHRNFYQKEIIDLLIEEIRSHLPEELVENQREVEVIQIF